LTGTDHVFQHLEEARDGSLDAIAWIVDRFSPYLLYASRRRLGRGRDWGLEAEDLVQEVWGVFLHKLPEFDVVQGRCTPVLMKFLSVTLNNLFRNVIRKGRARPLAGDRQDPRAESGGTYWQRLPAQTSGIVSKVMRGERAAHLQAAMSRLSERDREVLRLRGLDQVANADVAHLLGLAPKTVVARYRRALHRLAAELPGDVFDDLIRQDIEPHSRSS